MLRNKQHKIYKRRPTNREGSKTNVAGPGAMALIYQPCLGLPEGPAMEESQVCLLWHLFPKDCMNFWRGCARTTLVTNSEPDLNN